MPKGAMPALPLGVGALCLWAMAAAHAAEPVPVALESFQCTGMPLSVRLPARLSALRRLAPLQKEEVVRTEAWDGYQAIEVDLHFPGLSVGAVTFTNDAERYHLASARITGTGWSVGPFRVGQPAGPALRRAGVKGKVEEGAWRIDGLTDAVTVQVRAGRITGVVYDCYTG